MRRISAKRDDRVPGMDRAGLRGQAVAACICGQLHCISADKPTAKAVEFRQKLCQQSIGITDSHGIMKMDHAVKSRADMRHRLADFSAALQMRHRQSILFGELVRLGACCVKAARGAKPRQIALVRQQIAGSGIPDRLLIALKAAFDQAGIGFCDGPVPRLR